MGVEPGTPLHPQISFSQIKITLSPISRSIFDSFPLFLKPRKDQAGREAPHGTRGHTVGPAGWDTAEREHGQKDPKSGGGRYILTASLASGLG